KVIINSEFVRYQSAKFVKLSLLLPIVRKQYKSGVSQPTYPKRAKWGVKTWNSIFILGSIVWLVVGFSSMAWGQENRTTLTGTVVESSSGSPVAYANIILSRGDEQILTSSDTAGSFQFPELPFGIYRMTISSVGYQTLSILEVPIEHQNIPTLHIRLQPSTLMIEEVVGQADQAVTPAARLSGGYTLTPEEVRRFPATFYDPARLATVYPGILNVNDQANNLAIRGNSP